MRMLALNQSQKASSCPAQDGNRIGPCEFYKYVRKQRITVMPMENNVVLTPIKAVNKEIEACKICGSTTLPTRRTVLSNTKGKTKLGNDFQAYCAIDVEETERRILYCCRNYKSKLETLIKKINDIRDLYSCKPRQNKASP